jgi:hypothetical protein
MVITENEKACVSGRTNDRCDCKDITDRKRCTWQWIHLGMLLAFAVLDCHELSIGLELERPSYESSVAPFLVEKPLECRVIGFQNDLWAIQVAV